MGLIHDIPGKYTIKAIDKRVSPRTSSPLERRCSKSLPKAVYWAWQLKGEYNIRLNEDAKPFCMTSLRRVPSPLLEKLEKEITGLTVLDVIEPVEEPTEWCASVVVVPKPNGDIRMCVDLTS